MTSPQRPKWTDVRTGEVWQGLRLDLPREWVAGMRVEVTAGRRILIQQNNTAILTARVQQWMSHVDFARTKLLQPVVPPIRADHARRLANGSATERIARWAYHFAAELTESDAGPLHEGGWLLQPSAPYLWLSQHRDTSLADQWRELVLTDQIGEIDWYFLNGTGVILCLRDLSNVDDGRVKAYRKQAREGSIPPVLLWWVSGLTCYLLLDGHDRLLACLAEGMAPPLLTLSRLAEDTPTELSFEIARHSETTGHIERAISQGAAGAVEALAAERRRFGRAVEDHAMRAAPTRAWHLPDRVKAWRAAARIIDAAWLSEADPETGNGG